MEKQLISIIVPVYNVEKYLRRCLDSIINQTYNNIEILIINNGSTDNSLSICEEYSNNYDNILIYTKSHGTVASARNYGISKAKGDYIGFVDADDLINASMYEILYKSMIDNKVDIAMCSFKRFNELDENKIIKESIVKKRIDDIKIKVDNNEEGLKECIICEKYNVATWSKLFKREILKDIVMPECYTGMEDWSIIVDIFIRIKSICLIDEQLYYYYFRKLSLMNRIYTNSDNELINIFLRNHSLVKQYFPALTYEAKTNITAHYFYVIDKIIDSNAINNYKNDFDNSVLELKKNKCFVLFYSKHKIQRKIMYIIMLISVNLYVYMRRLYVKNYLHK